MRCNASVPLAISNSPGRGKPYKLPARRQRYKNPIDAQGRCRAPTEDLNRERGLAHLRH